MKESNKIATAGLSEESLNNIPGGIRIYEKTASGIICVGVNEYFAQMLGIPQEQLLGETFAQVEQRIHPEDRERHRVETIARLDAKRQTGGVYRIFIAKENRYRWYKLDGRLGKDGSGRELAYFHYTDVQNMKEAEEKEQRTMARYQATLAVSGLIVMDYDVKAKRVTMHNYQQSNHVLPLVFEQVPKSLAPYIAAEYMPAVEEVYAKADRGEKSSCEIWRNDGQGTALTCDRLSYDIFERDEDGQVIRAYGLSRDITAEKLREIRYQHSLTDYLKGNPDFRGTFHLNLTKNQCNAGHGNTDFILETMQAETADGFLANLASLVVEPQVQEEFRSVFNVEYLSACFLRGQQELDKTYYRREKPGEDYHWVTTYVRLLNNPETSDIEAYVYTVNADTKVQETKIIENLMAGEYDCIGLIHCKTGAIRFNHIKPCFADQAWAQQDTLAQSAAVWAEQIMDAAKRRDFLQQCQLPKILERLKQGHSKIQFLCTLGQGENSRRMVIKFSYLREVKQHLMFTISDVTASFRQEQEREERLKIALAAAQQASKAKSSFLSRMSHEIRTPMNAIIGMDALAAQAIGDDEQVSDCISKIGISARYLLSLINDILDMSRIESGKVLLKDEKFLLAEFISNINTMIYNQAAHKGLDYECLVSPNLAESYVGDAMKLQQVLINILGNAVKFTQKGKISLDVHPVSRNGKITRLRFVINDTGCGIQPEFLPKLFQPFEQGDESGTRPFGGTGLGLAISKSLIDIMGGTINVRSIVGVGSEFTFTVPLTDAPGEEARPLSSYNFANMKALVVDDDLIICEQAVVLLKELGMSCAWVTSGREAVEKVRQQLATQQYYNYIFIDWKMPEMDGIETTRQIRQLVGPEVTIIIISAYDWEAIANDAKAAGANLLITKPLFKSTLLNALKQAETRNVAAKQPKTETEYDFTGKRILLAEDNAINAEIARRLLENRHCSVELATNGLKALEKFVKQPAGYYDAIFMDVRMPLMDGLQATANIRHWDREDAKTIPIIAMTANAFDEDVEKSLAAGMNTHLSKPVEPQLLYQTLSKELAKKEKH